MLWKQKSQAIVKREVENMSDKALDGDEKALHCLIIVLLFVS